jgi:serine/threonine protein phosphatase PrpC
LVDFGLVRRFQDPAFAMHDTANLGILEDAFLAEACDGVCDVINNEEVAKFVTQRVE